MQARAVERFLAAAALAVAFLAGIPAEAAGARGVGDKGIITPALDPTSDKKFFDGKRADYPTDTKPEVKDHFENLYPAMQGTREFHDDFVKDDNGDGGHWDAQMKYDKLRMTVGRTEDKIAEAQRKEQTEARKLEDLKKREKTAEEERIAAESEAAKAKEAAAVARKAQAEADAKAKDEEEAGIGAATSLEDCKARLEAAKKRLEAARKAREAEGLSTEKHEAAIKSYDEELRDVKKAEKELEVAAEKLRQLRHGGKTERAQAVKGKSDDAKDPWSEAGVRSFACQGASGTAAIVAIGLVAFIA